MNHELPSANRMSSSEEQRHQAATWCLVDRNGKRMRLKSQLLFGRRENCEDSKRTCDIGLKSSSVDEQHAMLVFDADEQRFKLKDLGSQNGTFLNETRVPSGRFVMLEQGDSIRFGYDPTFFLLERSRSRSGVHSSGQPSPASSWSAAQSTTLVDSLEVSQMPAARPESAAQRGENDSASEITGLSAADSRQTSARRTRDVHKDVDGRGDASERSEAEARFISRVDNRSFAAENLSARDLHDAATEADAAATTQRSDSSFFLEQRSAQMAGFSPPSGSPKNVSKQSSGSANSVIKQDKQTRSRPSWWADLSAPDPEEEASDRLSSSSRAKRDGANYRSDANAADSSRNASQRAAAFTVLLDDEAERERIEREVDAKLVRILAGAEEPQPAGDASRVSLSQFVPSKVSRAIAEREARNRERERPASGSRSTSSHSQKRDKAASRKPPPTPKSGATFGAGSKRPVTNSASQSKSKSTSLWPSRSRAPATDTSLRAVGGDSQSTLTVGDADRLSMSTATSRNDLPPAELDEPAEMNYINTGTFTKSRDGSIVFRRLDAPPTLDDSKAYLLEKMLSDASTARTSSRSSARSNQADLKNGTKKPPKSATSATPRTGREHKREDKKLQQSNASATEYRLYPEARCFESPRDSQSLKQVAHDAQDDCEVHSDAGTYTVGHEDDENLTHEHADAAPIAAQLDEALTSLAGDTTKRDSPHSSDDEDDGGLRTPTPTRQLAGSAPQKRQTAMGNTSAAANPYSSSPPKSHPANKSQVRAGAQPYPFAENHAHSHAASAHANKRPSFNPTTDGHISPLSARSAVSAVSNSERAARDDATNVDDATTSRTAKTINTQMLFEDTEVVMRALRRTQAARTAQPSETSLAEREHPERRNYTHASSRDVSANSSSRTNASNRNAPDETREQHSSSTLDLRDAQVGGILSVTNRSNIRNQAYAQPFDASQSLMTRSMLTVSVSDTADDDDEENAPRATHYAHRLHDSSLLTDRSTDLDESALNTRRSDATDITDSSVATHRGRALSIGSLSPVPTTGRSTHTALTDATGRTDQLSLGARIALRSRQQPAASNLFGSMRLGTAGRSQQPRPTKVDASALFRTRKEQLERTRSTKTVSTSYQAQAQAQAAAAKRQPPNATTMFNNSALRNDATRNVSSKLASSTVSLKQTFKNGVALKSDASCTSMSLNSVGSSNSTASLNELVLAERERDAKNAGTKPNATLRQSAQSAFGVPLASRKTDSQTYGSSKQIAQISSALAKDLELLAQSVDLTKQQRAQVNSANANANATRGQQPGAHSNASANAANQNQNQSQNGMNKVHAEQSNGVLVSSVFHLTARLNRYCRELLTKLRDQSGRRSSLTFRSSISSPEGETSAHERSTSDTCFIDQLLSVGQPDDIAAASLDAAGESSFSNVYHAAMNRDLLTALENLKTLERQLVEISNGMLPANRSGRNSALGSCSDSEYQHEIERIAKEIRAFRPIGESAHSAQPTHVHAHAHALAHVPDAFY